LFAKIITKKQKKLPLCLTLVPGYGNLLHRLVVSAVQSELAKVAILGGNNQI
jgi:hypothetical protein